VTSGVQASFFHIFQIIPLLLIANIAGKPPELLAGLTNISSESLVLLGSISLYLCTFWKSSRPQKTCIFILHVALVALTLLRLAPEHPAIAAMVGAAFFMITTPKSVDPFSYKRMLLTTDTSLFTSLVTATFVLTMLLMKVDQQNVFLTLAVTIASTSLIYLSSARLKLNVYLVHVLVLSLLGYNLFLILQQPASNHIGFATIAFFLGTAPTAFTLFSTRSQPRSLFSRQVFYRPETIIVLFFGISATLGAVLLQMPMSQAQTMNHSFLDSLFTAMSAVCVTGLIVLDTPVDFSFFGQGVILLLIQLGGLGIVSLSSWVLFVFRAKRLSIQHEHAIAELSAYKHNISPKKMIKKIMTYFIALESLGAIILFFTFLGHGDDFFMAAWRAVFTAVSAFCNAGFALQSDSLIPYQANGIVMIVTSILIITGGFAPLLVFNLPGRKIKRWNLQEKISVSSTVFLLLFGLIFFLSLEWSHSLAHLGVMDKLSNAWFQSVTTRTAGFNSVDFSAMREVTMFLCMFLMFIGGNPGSAAGGIKTVTAAVIFYAGLSVLRGDPEARAFNRQIDTAVVYKAVAVAGLGLVVGFCAYLMLAVTQQIDTVSLLFETVSALGTAGLSVGATTELDEVGKVIIILCMLAGRIGPVTFALLLLRGTPRKNWDTPRDDVFIS
jgi:trk system potassium uptake protein TrkH